MSKRLLRTGPGGSVESHPATHTTVSVRLTPSELAELDAFRADLGSFGALSDPSPGSWLSRGAAVKVALLGTMAGRLIRRSRAGKAKGAK